MEQRQTFKGGTIEADFFKIIKEKTEHSDFNWLRTRNKKTKIVVRKENPESKGIREIKIIGLQKYPPFVLIILIIY